VPRRASSKLKSVEILAIKPALITIASRYSMKDGFPKTSHNATRHVDADAILAIATCIFRGERFVLRSVVCLNSLESWNEKRVIDSRANQNSIRPGEKLAIKVSHERDEV